ncbi:MAG: D-alanyl-D-alanine carboxypeptidase [Clostridia bacterium]|nr:D-alanyl-D-alanine carboxypeptidase [Clostridia bacterium]
MKKIVAFSLAFLLLIGIVAPVTSYAAAPDVTAEAVYVLEQNSGKVLYEKNAEAKMYPASTTKLMTALLVLESVKSPEDYDEVITASTGAVTHENLSGNGSTAGVLPGEKLTLDELLHFLLIQSANDAANVLAEHVAGSVSLFVTQMNARAAELGMSGTKYVNPHGEHNEGHYTTAKDLAILLSEIVKHEKYCAVASTRQYRKEPTNKYKLERIFNNTNKLINPNSAFYNENVIAGKTGFTTPAGYCLATYAEKDGLELIVVTMKSAKDPEVNAGYHFNDQTALYKWLFSIYKNMPIVPAGTPVCEIPVRLSETADTVTVLTVDEVCAVVNTETYDEALVSVVPQQAVKELVLDAPVAKGQKVGLADVYYDGQAVGTVSLSAITGVERSGWLYTKDRIGAFFALWPVRILILLLVIAAGTWIYLRERAVRRRRMENRLRRYR